MLKTTAGEAQVNNEAALPAETAKKPGRWRSWVGVGLFFALLTLFFSYPLIFNFTSAVPGMGVEDRLQNLWNFWWVRKSFLDTHWPYLTDLLFYPYYQYPLPSLPLYFHDLQAFSGFITLPFQLIGGETAAYNATVLLQTFASAIGTYCLTRKLGASRPAALIAGSIYAFAPIRTSAINQSITNIQATEFLPFYAFFLLAGRRVELATNWWAALNKKMVVGAVLMLVFCAYTDWYNTIYLLAFTAFYFVGRLLTGRNWRQWWGELRYGLVVGLPAMLLVAPLLIPSVDNLDNPAFKIELGYDREINSSATLLSLLFPEQTSALTPVNTLSYVGIFFILLAGLALLRPLGGKGWLSRKTAFYWLLLVVIALVLALGPELRLTRTFDTGFPMPYKLFRKLPVVSVTRAPARFVILAMLGIAVLTAFGLDWLATGRRISRAMQRVSKAWQPRLSATLALSAVTLVLFTFDLWSPLQLFPVQANPFMQSLAKEPGNFYLLELPITRHYNHDHYRMFNQISHERPIIGGYLSRPVIDPYRFPDSAFKPIADFAIRDPKKPPIPDIILRTNNYQDLDDLVSVYNFRYIVLYRQEFDDPNQLSGVNDVLAAHYGAQQKVYQDDEIIVYKVPQDYLASRPNGVDLTLGGGWYDLEQDPSSKEYPMWRWAQGDSRIYATSVGNNEGQISLTLHSFSKPRTLQVQVNNQTVFTGQILPDQIKTVSFWANLPAGRNTISLRSLEGDTSPVEIDPKSQDVNRRLAFAVYSAKVDIKK